MHWFDDGLGISNIFNIILVIKHPVTLWWMTYLTSNTVQTSDY